MKWIKELLCGHYYLPVDKRFSEQYQDRTDEYAGELFNRYTIKEICQYCNKVRYRSESHFAEYDPNIR